MATTHSGSPGAEHGDGAHGSGGIIGKVRDRATAQLAAQKDKAIDGIGSVTHAVRQSTQQLRDQQHDTLAGYVERAANEIDRLSQQLRNKDVGELFEDAQRLARRQPALFIASAFALGLIGARFLKSSSRRDDEYDDDRYDEGDYTRGSSGRGGAGLGTGRYTSEGGGYRGAHGDYTAGTAGRADAAGTGPSAAAAMPPSATASTTAASSTGISSAAQPEADRARGTGGATSAAATPTTRTSSDRSQPAGTGTSRSRKSPESER